MSEDGFSPSARPRAPPAAVPLRLPRVVMRSPVRWQRQRLGSETRAMLRAPSCPHPQTALKSASHCLEFLQLVLFYICTMIFLIGVTRLSLKDTPLFSSSSSLFSLRQPLSAKATAWGRATKCEFPLAVLANPLPRHGSEPHGSLPCGSGTRTCKVAVAGPTAGRQQDCVPFPQL